MMIPSHNCCPSFNDIKAAAPGRWIEILKDAGLPTDCLDNRGRPCPLFGGDDRYNAAKDIKETGAVFCRKCFNKSSPIKPGDGIATVVWLQKSTNGEAAKRISDWLGLTGKPAKPVDIITATARDKRMPVEAFKKFGVKETTRGRGGRKVARVDVYDGTGKPGT